MVCIFTNVESGTGCPSLLRTRNWPDVIRLGAELALRLNVYLPHASEAIEVVNKEPPHEGLERLVHRTQIDSLLEHLVAVHVGKDLRGAGDERRGERSELGPLAGGLEESIRILRQEGDILAGAVLEHEGRTAGRANARNRGRREGERLGFGKPGEPLVEAVHDDIGG